MRKPEIITVSEMLTPSEIEQLHQSARDANDFFQKELAQKKKKQSELCRDNTLDEMRNPHPTGVVKGTG